MAKKKSAQPVEANSTQSAVQPLPTIINSIGMTMAIVPKGTAVLQVVEWHVQKGRRDKVVKKKIASPFLMGLYPVTQSQFQFIMEKNPSDFRGDTLPVEMVTWTEANQFCEKLSAVPDEVAAGRTYRLPSEEEWEYACRAGTEAAYSFGDDIQELGLYGWFGGGPGSGPDAGNSGKTTHPVGEKGPNPWGFFDMHGNVWEWCSNDAKAMRGSTERVVRGGSYYHTAAEAQSNSRMHFKENVRSSTVGFRVVAECIVSE
jgi:formylglycine-generating enzyme required for sulfatase activity